MFINLFFVMFFLFSCSSSGKRRPFLSENELTKVVKGYKLDLKREDIYLINLKKSTDRIKIQNRQFAEKFPIGFTRFEAIYGKDIPYDRKKKGVQRLNPEKGWEYEFYKSGLAPGEIGVYLSHYEIIRNIKDNKKALIFEDDVILSDNFDAKIKSLMSHAPDDWNIIYLFCHDCKNKGFSLTKNGRFLILNKSCVPTTPAYIIRNKEKFFDKLMPMREPLDVFLGSLHKDTIKAYCAYPEIASQDFSSSTIDEQGGRR